MQSEKCPFAEMRAIAPVVEMAPGTYAVTRHAECRAILMDWQTYSARVGENNMFAVFGPSPAQEEIDRIMQRYPETPVLMRADPPEHTRVRDLVKSVLTTAVVRQIEPQIEALVREFADRWLKSGQCEFVSGFAALLPNAVTTSFLGLPPEARGKTKFWADEVMSRFEGPQSPERQIAVATSIAEMGDFFYAEIADRRANPTDDLISLLAHTEIDGDRLADAAIVNVIETFMIGGHETTTFLLGNALWRLANDPDLAELLRESPEKIAPFVEEMLRLEAPARMAMRSPTRDVEIGGVPVPAGATLLVMLASANRDERIYDAPDELRIDRPRPDSTPGTRHLAFGYGAHACIGLHLARAEVRIALNYLLPRMQQIAPASDDPIERLDNVQLRGPIRLNLKFDARAMADAA